MLEITRVISLISALSATKDLGSIHIWWHTKDITRERGLLHVNNATKHLPSHHICKLTWWPTQEKWNIHVRCVEYRLPVQKLFGVTSDDILAKSRTNVNSVGSNLRSRRLLRITGLFTQRLQYIRVKFATRILRRVVHWNDTPNCTAPKFLKFPRKFPKICVHVYFSQSIFATLPSV